MNPSCDVCMVEFATPSDICTTSCNHQFCANCLPKLTVCAICRTPIARGPQPQQPSPVQDPQEPPPPRPGPAQEPHPRVARLCHPEYGCCVDVVDSYTCIAYTRETAIVGICMHHAPPSTRNVGCLVSGRRSVGCCLFDTDSSIGCELLQEQRTIGCCIYNNPLPPYKCGCGRCVFVPRTDDRVVGCYVPYYRNVGCCIRGVDNVGCCIRSNDFNGADDNVGCCVDTTDNVGCCIFGGEHNTGCCMCPCCSYYCC